MEATLTSKGQLTLPKAIRDHLGLVTGTRLDFSVQPDRTITVRVISNDPLAVCDVLPPPKRRNVSEEEIQAAIRQGAVSRFLRSTRSR